MSGVGIKDRKHFSEAFLQPALDNGLVEMTQPDKPKSSKQRYRITALGLSTRSRGEALSS
jgi:ATP-dependent DNA helicase RecG